MSLFSELLNVLFPRTIDGLKQGVGAIRTAHTERQDRFVIDAIGSACCLIMAEAVPGEISLESIDGRIRNAQNYDPNEAHRCGIPDVNDEQRRAKIRAMLHRMSRSGKLRYHPVDKWSVR